jgi:5-formyltetrahydrofolate cyclo-ligase
VSEPDKRELRKHFRALRRTISAGAHEEASRRIAERVRALPEFSDARTVHSYWPVSEQREVDVRPLLDDLVEKSIRVILPVVLDFGPPTGSPRLSHVEYRRGMKMKPNRWMILEPVDATPASTDEIDLIIVPALACDTKGTRLGHGLGYYDEFLSQTPGLRLCACMDSFVVDTLPADPLDQRVDVIVTESRLIRTQEPD